MKTVGVMLSEARARLGVSLEEVEAAIKIRKSVLQALESGDYARLPSPTHIKGFLQNYGKYLDLNVSELLAVFRREYDEQKNSAKVSSGLKAIKRPLFILTPTIVIIAFILICVSLVSFYLYQQYQVFTDAPKLTVSEPVDNLKTPASTISVVGQTYPDAILKVNGGPVQLSPSGSFVVAVDLPPGTNILNITAENKFGKIRQEKRVVIVEPLVEREPVSEATPSSDLAGANPDQSKASPSATIKEPKADRSQATLKVGQESVWVRVEVDGTSEFEGVLVSGVSKTFDYKERIKIKTSNGGFTRVLIDGQDKGMLGEEGKEAEKEFGR
jgi:cytoskeleton protein RodZ